MLKVEVIVVKNVISISLLGLYMNISHVKKFGEHLTLYSVYV
jgi:hypothetical protein